MKLAKVIPIYKKDDPTQVTNYRPISLQPVLSKVVEKTIAKQLSEYFEENKLFNQNQFGFRTGHSTEHAALELVDKITSQMDNNETPINICLDLSKAFDTIDHNILLEVKRTLSLLRKGFRSTWLWESPRVPSERYEPRPCLCVFVARFDRRILYYSSKTDSSWGCVANVTASHLLMARPLHCLSATPGCVTPPGWALPTQYPVQLTNTVYTHGVY